MKRQFRLVAGGANLAVSVTGGTVAFGATQHLAGLTITAGSVAKVTAASRSVLVTQALSVTGTLDLAGNDLDLETGGLQTVWNLVAAGYDLPAGGTWSGPGITSSTAAADTSHLTALGVIQNNQSGTAVYTAVGSFDGVTPGTADILVKYTYFGDANLDGKVDGSDYSLIDAGYAGGGKLTGRYNGDFNHDGVVDGSDYALIDNAFNNQGASLSASALTATDRARVAGVPVSAVPEPGVGAMVVVAALAARRRWRRPLTSAFGRVHPRGTTAR